ncbi:MAG: hypothetical protein JO257_07855 [Deltaproteobacteria bacterium]|nr:hypothetical protein [Deltaproteobacteria bacterium]
MRAYETRGAIELDRGARWPRTTGSDVIIIAALFDPAIRAHGTPGVLRRWRVELDAMETDALTGARSTYPGGRSFWRTLEVVAVFLDDMMVAPPVSAVWDALIAQIGERPRNAGPTGDGPFKKFENVKTFDDLFNAQLGYLREKRGADTLAQPAGYSGGDKLIPRSTNADVIALAEYWTTQLGRVKHIAERDAIDARWKAAVADVDKIARASKPDDAYAKNNEFWRVLQQTAVHVAVADEAPSKADLAIASLETSLAHLPQTIGAAAEKSADFVADVAHAAGKVVNEAGKGLLAGVGKPFLYGAIGAVGLYFLTRGRRHESAES